MSQTARQNYRTPLWFFEGLQKILGVEFELDAAASANNTLCRRHYSIADDGLKSPWVTWTWCNPPHGRVLPWARKALEELHGHRHVKSVLLLPARVETRWYQLLHKHKAVSVFHLTPRLNYIDPDTNLPLENIPLTSSVFVIGTKQKRIGYVRATEGKIFEAEFSV
jgi:site-specific DNA-methyltransferase (adenine-specific)